MSQLTFVTHLRFDHEYRIKNFQNILNYYSSNIPNSKFVVVEDDVEHNKNFDKITWPKGTTYLFFKNEGLYHRTKALNIGIKYANTPFVVSLDTDCLVPKKSLIKCIEALSNGATIAWPYNGYVIDISYEMYEQFTQNGQQLEFFYSNLPVITDLQLGQSTNAGCTVRCTNNPSQLGVGGIVMFHKNKFIELGGYNEKFIAWGGEDNELDQRILTLQHKKFRDESSDAILFHLPHPNAIRHNNPYYQSNAAELIRVEKMSKLELESYIKTWNYFK
jgi:predicted glycosyltransferase involved in capsule biosynthesis